LGFILSPKSKEYSGGLIINLMFWEFNYRWGLSKNNQTQLQILEKQIEKAYKNNVI
jgi:hypothetical protein